MRGGVVLSSVLAALTVLSVLMIAPGRPGQEAPLTLPGQPDLPSPLTPSEIEELLEDVEEPGVTSDPRVPSAGRCTGPPPPMGQGMQRRPDTARDPQGNLHVVWQESTGTQSEICYARQPGELGLGSDTNPAYRITDSVSDSVAPHVAVDAASGIVYVAWTEVLIWTEVVVGEEMHQEIPMPAILYTATDASWSGEPMWTEAQAIADGRAKVHSFFVDDSRYVGVLQQQGRVQLDEDWNGEFDTDRDGIKDSDEANARSGYKTMWWNADTDGDGLPDKLEIVNLLDPTIHIFIEWPDCFPRGVLKICDLIFILLCLSIDSDGDGLSNCEEGGAFPVTTEVGEYGDGDAATYRFWPKVNGAHDLVLRTQQRTLDPGGNCTSVSVAVTADAAAVGTFTQPWDDAVSVWSIDTVASVAVAGVNFNAVTASMAVDIGLTVTFDPAGCDKGTNRVLALDWLKLELASDRSEVNYKDADDVVGGPPSFTVLTEEMVIQLDPQQKDVLFELDSMANHPFDPFVLNGIINAFSDLNVIVNYKIDQTGLSDTGTNAIITRDPTLSTDEGSTFLSTNRNPALAASYIHVMNVARVARPDGADVCGTAEQAGPAPGGPAAASGILLADQAVLNGWCSGFGTVTIPQIQLALFLHEGAHGLGAAHDLSTGAVSPIIDGTSDTCNLYNVMGYTYCAGNIPGVITGSGNTDRRFGASSPIGGPRYSIESVAQFTFTNKLSVDTGYNLPALGSFV